MKVRTSAALADDADLATELAKPGAVEVAASPEQTANVPYATSARHLKSTPPADVRK
jgi:hypothetical protein